MGAGIAQVSAEKGMTVLLKDRQGAAVVAVAWCLIQVTMDRRRSFR